MKSLRVSDKIIAIVLGLSIVLLLGLAVWHDNNRKLPDDVAKSDTQTETQSSEQESFTETESATEPENSTETESATEPESSTEAEVILLNENPLTGEFNLTDGAVGKRPVAVMINNVKKSMPQYGIAQADIIFEIPVEGFLTRFMAVYADYTQMPKICSIRSCREYFPAIAKGFDAVYVYSGMAEPIRDYVNSLNMTEFEGGRNHGGLFGRDQERRDAGYSLEHTMYFDGTGIVEAMEERKLRSDILEDKKGAAFLFYESEVAVVPEGDACTVVEIDFGAAEATLTYDEITNMYWKDFNGNPQIDGVTETQLAFTNVFVLETTIGTADNGTHKDVDWHGGKGYYVSKGVVQEITWAKKDEASDLIFYNASGEELCINRGKSYIAINRKGRATFAAE